MLSRIDQFDGIRRCRLVSAAALMLLVGAAAAPAQARLILQVESVAASAGSTSNSLEVTLTNTGPDAVSLDGFSFGLGVGSDVSFTGATIATNSAYIFDGHSAYGPNIETSTGSTLEASDAYDTIGGSISLVSGATVGLGHVLFDVSAQASGVYAVRLTQSPATSLSLGNADVPVTELVDGSITVATVPEPSSVVLAGTASFLAMGCGWRRRRVA